MIYQGKAQYPVHEIILHAAATRPDWMAGKSIEDKIAEITRWHKKRGWRTIGYHWVIDRDGKIAAGRPENVIGAHVKGRNKGTVGICLLGGHGGSADDTFEEHFTQAQRKAAWRLIRQIADRTEVRAITGHNRYAAKACPCFPVEVEFPWPPAKEKQPQGFDFSALLDTLAKMLGSILHGKRP